MLVFMVLGPRPAVRCLKVRLQECCSHSMCPMTERSSVHSSEELS